MRILSLHFGLQSSVCLFEDGQVVTLIEKERLSRISFDQGCLPVERILAAHSWAPEDIDLVVFNPYVSPNLDGQLYQWQVEGEAFAIRSSKTDVDSRYSTHQLQLQNQVYQAYAIDPQLAHVASGYYASPFTKAVVMSADRGGQGHCSAFAKASGNKIESLEYGWGKESEGERLNLGMLWETIAWQHFSWRSYEGVQRLESLATQGCADEKMMQVLHAMALCRSHSSFPLELWGQYQSRLDPASQFSKDLAASLQQLTDNEYIEASEYYLDPASPQDLVLTGDLSLNTQVNDSMASAAGVKDCFVAPIPYDAGLALGQAFFVYHHVLGNARKCFDGMPFWGTQLSGQPSRESIAEASKSLQAGKLIATSCGKAESGLNARGQRSLLADPCHETAIKRMRQSRGEDEYARISALVLEEDYADYFEGSAPLSDGFTRHCKPKCFKDGWAFGKSLPVQIVSQDEDSLARSILLQLKADCSYALLMNASFKGQEPPVETFEQAVACWQRSPIDELLSSHGLEQKHVLESEQESAVERIALFSHRPFEASSSDLACCIEFQVDPFDELNSAILQNCYDYDLVCVDYACDMALALSHYLDAGPSFVIRLQGSEIYEESDKLSELNWARVDALVLESEAFREILLERCELDSERVFVIPAGVDLQAIRWVDKEEADPVVRKSIAVLGDLSTKKGSQLLPMIAHELADYRILVGGAVREECILDVMAEVPSNLVLAGYIPAEMRNDFFAEASYFLNVSAQESFGKSIGEAMAAGLSPLIYCWAGAEEIWPKTQCWKSMEELKALLEVGYVDSIESRRFVCERYDELQCKKQLFELFHNLCEQVEA